MTAIGKMLTFLVLLLSLGWFYLTANAYVARVNWRAEAKRYQDDAQKMRDAAEKANAVILANRDAAADSRKALGAERDRLQASVKTLTDSQKDLNTLYAAAFADAQSRAAKAADLQANIDKLLLEKQNADRKLVDNLDQLNKLALETSRAKAAETEAKLEARALRAQNESTREQLAKVQQENFDIKNNRVPGEGGQPAPRGLRASVTEFNRDRSMAEINLGLEAGLTRGMKLDVTREDQGGGKYLGTLTLTVVDAKSAAGNFTPASGRRLDASSYPRPNDIVRAN